MKRLSVFFSVFICLFLMASCSVNQNDGHETNMNSTTSGETSTAETSESTLPVPVDDLVEDYDAIAQTYTGYPDFITVPKLSDHRIYVDPKTDISRGDGSFNSPCKSLNIAISKAKPGDTIYLREGTYGGRYDISSANSADAWICIKAYKNEKVVFTDNYGSCDSCIVFASGAAYWKLEGFEIQKYAGAGVWIKDGAGNIYVENMNIHDISTPDLTPYGTEGILGGGNNVLVRGCTISDIGTHRLAPHDHCIYLAAQNWVIDSNILQNAPGGGIHQYASGAEEAVGKNVYIWNNIIRNNLYGIVLSSCSDYYISNNIIYNSRSDDFYLTGYIKNSVIQNNIFYSDFKSGDTYQGGRWDAIDIKTKTVQNLFSECSDGQLFTNNSFKNNIIYRKSGQYSIYLNGGWYNIDNIATTDKNNTYESFIKSDPLFVDAAGGNFTLSENSPALSGASENEYTPTYGYGHNQRSASSFGIN